MKVITDYEDRHGRQALLFQKTATPAAIYEWLFTNGYQGFMYCIVFNLVIDEFQEQGMTAVYYADTVLDEIATYSDR